MHGKAAKLLKRMKWAKEELYRSFSKEEGDRIWKAVHDRLEGYLEEYADIPEGERMHTDSRIFPMAAIYLSVKDAAGEEFAFDFIRTKTIGKGGDCCDFYMRKSVK